jgi:hypothetical protein
MKRVSAAIRVGCLDLTCTLLWSAVANAQTAAVDSNFVGQANLGAPFQVDSGTVERRHLAAVRR